MRLIITDMLRSFTWFSELNWLIIFVYWSLVWDWYCCLERNTLLLRNLEIDFWSWMTWWGDRLLSVSGSDQLILRFLTHWSWLRRWGLTRRLRWCFRPILNIQILFGIVFRLGYSYGLRWRRSMWSIYLSRWIDLDRRSVISSKVSWRI